jgi:indole-3-glycerol phosphate synthase
VILDDILAHKVGEVEAARRALPLVELKSRLSDAGNIRPFTEALRRRAGSDTAVIAEVKKGSPSKGVIRPDFDPLAIARCYSRAGAACLSVLTDEKFFLGRLSYLNAIRQVVDLPLLRKEFIIDPYQVYEARVFGADAILLIAAALDDAKLSELAGLAAELQMDVLLEVHDESELERALRVPTPMVGINNRDLKTFHTDLAVTERLLPHIPADRLVVAESGIRTREDICRLQKAGAGAFLIGESLVREKDIESKLSVLLGTRECSID